MNPDTPYSRKLLVLGSESAFTGIVLTRLLEAGTNLCGLVIRDPHPPPRAFEPSANELRVVVGGMGPAIAVQHDVPIIPVGPMHDEQVLERVRGLRPHILLVACFPMILDKPWLSLPSEMCLNLHPSLLPSYRGPTPLFWQFREGEHETGVTLHLIEPEIDAGDIVAQSTMALPAGLRFSEINAQLAHRGAELVLDVLEKLGAGVEIPRTTQDKWLASYQPFPKETDFRFDTHFTAERAFRFIQGTGEWGVPFEVDAGDATFIVSGALGFHDTARMSTPYEIDGERIRIRCSEGVLEVVGRLAS